MTTMLSRRRAIQAAAGVAVLSSTFGRRSSSRVALAEPTSEADFAGTVDIGGRSLFVDRRGSGDATVVLEAGAGNDARVWDEISLPMGSTEEAVLPAVAAFATVCAYDRPGTFLGPGLPGRSDPAAMPRTAADMVADLHELLATASISAPYVLVGHSFGGLIVRLYASTYPDDVAGMVLVDAAHEDYYKAAQALMTPAQWDTFANAADDPDYPNLERVDTLASSTEMREAAESIPLPEMPLVVLTHGRPWTWPDDMPGAALEDLWLPLQRDLASLVLNARFVIAEQSGHFIQVEQPDLVVEAIRPVIEGVRNPGSWTS